MLGRLLKGKRVLVFGRGPSALAVKSIPEDVVVLSCNCAPVLLREIGYTRPLGVYLCPGFVLAMVGGEVHRALSGSGIVAFVTDNPHYVRCQNHLRGKYLAILSIFGHMRFFERLIYPAQRKDFFTRGSNESPFPSMGVRLLSYALYFGASDVYTAGIDLGCGGSISGEKYFLFPHKTVDTGFLQIVGKRFPNLYSVSPQSPICEFIGCKSFNSG